MAATSQPRRASSLFGARWTVVKYGYGNFPLIPNLYTAISVPKGAQVVRTPTLQIGAGGGGGALPPPMRVRAAAGPGAGSGRDVGCVACPHVRHDD